MHYMQMSKGSLNQQFGETRVSLTDNAKQLNVFHYFAFKVER